MIKAIETVYNGYRFRSRLEARWAVYLDRAGLKYEYEAEGFELGGGVRYLPDFWLPQVSLFAEVKPVEFSAIERMKVDALVRMSGFGCVLLVGTPSFRTYEWRLIENKKPISNDVIFSNYHEYATNEQRFYANTEFGLGGLISESEAEDYLLIEPVNAARSARFEFNKSSR